MWSWEVRIVVDDSFGVQVEGFGERRCTYLDKKGWSGIVANLGADSGLWEICY